MGTKRLKDPVISGWGVGCHPCKAGPMELDEEPRADIDKSTLLDALPEVRPSPLYSLIITAQNALCD